MIAQWIGIAMVASAARGAAFETTIYRYTPLVPGQIASRLTAELLKRGIPAGTQEGLGNTGVSVSASLRPERERLEALRAELVAQLRNRITPRVQAAPVIASVGNRTPEPLQEAAFNATEFRGCARRAADALKVEFQHQGTAPILESTQLERGDGAGHSADGVYCGKWLGPFGGKVQSPRENLKLLLAMTGSTPSADHALWVAFWAARHPRSPLLTGEAHEFMELALWRAAFEATLTPGNMHSLESLADQFSRSGAVTSSLAGGVRAFSTGATFTRWTEQASQFAQSLVQGAVR